MTGEATDVAGRRRPRAAHQPALGPRLRAILVNAAIYLICIALVSAFWQRPSILFGAGAIISCVLIGTRPARLEVALYLCGFCCGPLAEWVCVEAGAWTYPGSRWLLPIWLPFAWGIAVLVISRTARAFAAAGDN